MMSENEAGAVREGEELDVTAVDRILKNNIDGLSGQPEISQFSGGSSNLTYLIQYPDSAAGKGRELVLRRPPFGAKAKSAHNMAREYEIMTALKAGFATVPETYFYSGDETLIGSEFFVMQRVPGTLIGRELPTEWNLSAVDTRKLAFSIFDKLIDLHQLDYKAVGLVDFGKPEGYVKRQVEGWSGRYVKALTDDVEDYADIRQWLLDKMPAKESRHSIVHGDFRIDNVILSPNDHFQVDAVLDWELSTFGDPLMDLANTLAYWVQADDGEVMQNLVIQPSNAPGMPSRAELLNYYAERTGISINNFDFYAVYGYFRNAVILQQIYYRYKHGQTTNPKFAMFGFAVGVLGEHCRQLIRQSTL
jgi:aminoglycoside phosphotransferase (APT) family kinase protein